MIKSKTIALLGIRGIPARHGGFETFAEYLCKYLVERNWKVVVYCQEEGGGPVYESNWQGVKRIHIPVRQAGALGTVVFDFCSIFHSLRHQGIFLTLGYNTALFNVFHRVFGKTNIINMDGVEWKRKKWGAVAKAWFWLNERFGCWFGNQLVADHPRIEDHLATRVSRRKITMIPYGGLHVESADQSKLAELALEADDYSVVIARAEPENSLLEIVQGFSRKPRGHKLVVLGNYSEDNAYQRAVKEAASEEVIFPGAIYDVDVVSALRFYARFYIHGHQVGGTNPSLVEALGAGNAVLAHDNPFNHWVAADGAEYFSGADDFSRLLEKLLHDEQQVAEMKRNSASQFNARFQWDSILEQYETLLLKHYPKGKL